MSSESNWLKVCGVCGREISEEEDPDDWPEEDVCPSCAAEEAAAKMQTSARRWLGPLPKTCDLCGNELDDFVDGLIQHGPWAIMCPSCHEAHGCGLGIGRGQHYDSEGLLTKGGWEG